MLKINKSKFSLRLPRLRLTVSPTMELSPAIDDDDELTRAVADDVDRRDDNWQLTEGLDETALAAYWASVETDSK